MRTMTSVAVAGILGLAGMLAAGTSNASPIVFQTPTGAMTSGGSVSAMASFTLSANTLGIQLTDTEANPTDVAQLISGLSFTLSNGLSLANGTLTSSMANFVTVATGGSLTASGSGPTGWMLYPSFTLCDICSSSVSGGTSVPAGLIIGPPGSGSTYSAANGSIAGNKPHNPFIDQTASYTLNIQGLSAIDSISSVTFRFGTTYGTDTVNGVCTADCGGTSVAEPGALALFGAGLLGCALFINRRRRASRES
ncbi:MAG: PEP-CTERM sorting domain-containing protein [Steroidobacteraceae bacterium]